MQANGQGPALSASDADLDVVLDRPPFDPGMSVWAEIAEKELKERENESAHRKLSRYEARMIWLAAQEMLCPLRTGPFETGVFG